MPSDRDVMALSTWDAQDEPSDPYDLPMCDCCERVEVNRPGDICAACEPELGRNSAADGTGAGSPSLPAPAPVETGRNQAADGAGDGASLQALDDHPTPAPVDPIVDRWAPHWPAAPSLPMDLCSDIPEDDR